jgi:hypothetical protein
VCRMLERLQRGRLGPDLRQRVAPMQRHQQRRTGRGWRGRHVGTGDGGGSMCQGLPCARACPWQELFGWLVHTGCATEDVVRRYITHLTPNSEHATWTAA